NVHRRDESYRLLSHVTTYVWCPRTFSGRLQEASTGARRIANSVAPTSAKPYVSDMGAKIFPGTPCMVKSGISATMITRTENKTGRTASEVASAIKSWVGSPAP